MSRAQGRSRVSLTESLDQLAAIDPAVAAAAAGFDGMASRLVDNIHTVYVRGGVVECTKSCAGVGCIREPTPLRGHGLQ